MRLRLVHTLSLLLLSSVVIAVAALGGLVAWNLRNGFNDYLATRDIERLEKFAAIVERSVQDAGGADALVQRRIGMRVVMDEFLQGEGQRRPADAANPDQARFEPDAAAADGAPPGPRGPQRGPPEAFQWRVWVVGLDGQTLLGRAQPGPPGRDVERPIRSQGRVIAWARMRPTVPALGGVEAHFLRSQYVRILAVSAMLAALALAGAGWFARRWSSPLLAVKEATARIARGQFDVRLGDVRLSRRGDEIGDVVRNVNRMAESLQRLDTSRRRLIADIAHELRTPLTVLRGHAEALVDGVRPLGPESMLILRDEISRLEALVEDLHLLALSDLKALPCRFDACDALALVAEVKRRFDPRAAAADVVLRVESAAMASLPVRWDHARIAQVLGNLVENSLRYTDAPGSVLIQVRLDAQRVVLLVEDSAPGVSDADLARLFEPLFRADRARSRHSGGSGLGLAICAAIVHAHGGQIAAAASTLGGLAVKITLPMTAAEITA
jgi:two-component system sensor histidine kinase BaeS